MPSLAPAAKTKLDRTVIVEAALRLLEEVGLDGLSTRALAAALGVKGPSLYWHFQNMGELRDLMADAILADALAAADGPGDWRHWLAEGARAIRSSALAHRDGARVIAGSRPGEKRRIRFAARIERLEREGFTGREARAAFIALSRFALGSALAEQATRETPDIFEFGLKAMLDGLAPQRV